MDAGDDEVQQAAATGRAPGRAARHGPAAAVVALALATAGLVGLAAATPGTGGTDDAPAVGAVSGLDVSSLDAAGAGDGPAPPTSAPRIALRAGDGSGVALDADGFPPLPLAATTPGDASPVTGGLTDLIRRYFGSDTVEALVIVQCESGFDALAVGTNANGTQDHGLFQINDVHERAFPIVTGRSWEERYDPEVNTAFAAWLFGRSGWDPWTCRVRLDQSRDGSPEGEERP